MSRLCISGSRNYHKGERKIVIQEVEKLLGQWLQEVGEAINVILIGDCPTGVDEFVRSHYRKEIDNGANRVLLLVFAADWGFHGNRAGPIRNQEMIDRADVLLAFPLAKSRGTIDTIRRAKRKGIHVYIYQDGHIHLEKN